MGNNNRHQIESRMKVLLMHLLKWQFQPQKRQTGHSWEDTVYEQRKQILLLIESTPSLQNLPRNQDWLLKIWKKSLEKAAAETGLPKTTFPAAPVWTVEEILNPEFFPLSVQELQENRKPPHIDDDWGIGY